MSELLQQNFQYNNNQQIDRVRKNSKLFEDDKFINTINNNPNIMNQLHDVLDIDKIVVLYDRKLLQSYLQSSNKIVFNIIKWHYESLDLWIKTLTPIEWYKSSLSQELSEDLNSIYKKEYTDFNEYLKNHPIWEINLPSWLNKQQHASRLPEDSMISWNRFLMYKWMNNQEILQDKEKLHKQVNDFFEYTKLNVLRNNDYKEKLAKEMNLQPWLEKIYFGKLKEWSIVRVDFWYPTLFEFDDFPRWIFYASILEEYENSKNWLDNIKPSFVNHIDKMIAQDEQFVFVLHDTASHANFQEHIHMAKLLNHYNVNSICISHVDREKNMEEQENWDLFYDWVKIGWVWHHLMNTKEAPSILNQISDANIPLLPHFHSISHKWIQNILSDEYDNWKLDKKNYTNLIDEAVIPYSKLVNSDSSIDYKWIHYNSYKDLFNKNENDLVVKFIWAENAEWVYILKTMTSKEKNKLYEVIDSLENKSNIMIQHYNPSKNVQIPVYNSFLDKPEVLKWQLLSRLFYVVKEWKLVKLTGIDQITIWSKAHGMVDMASYYSF